MSRPDATRLDADTVRETAGEAGCLAVLRALGVDIEAGRRSGANLTRLRLPPALGEDRNPSLSVHLTDWTCHDFGGHFDGTLFQLVEAARRCFFPEAVAWVADVCRVEVREAGSCRSAPELSRPEPPQAAAVPAFWTPERAERLRAAQARLSDGHPLVQMVRRRDGLEPETLRRFGCGIWEAYGHCWLLLPYPTGAQLYRRESGEKLVASLPGSRPSASLFGQTRLASAPELVLAKSPREAMLVAQACPAVDVVGLPGGERPNLGSAQAEALRGLLGLRSVRVALDCDTPEAAATARSLAAAVAAVVAPAATRLVNVSAATGGEHKDLADVARAGEDVAALLASGQTVEPLPEPQRAEPLASPSTGYVEAPPERFEAVLDEAALYGLGGDIVRTLRPHTEASDPAVLGHFLTAFGVAVGMGPHVAVGNDPHPPRLFAVFVGPTGRGRKGTAHAAVRPIWERACPGLIARTRSNIQSGEALIELVRDGDGGEDPGVSDKRLLLIESEYANVLNVRRRVGSILTGVLRQAWDSGDLYSTTKRPVRATGAHVGLCAHITPDELRRLVDAGDALNGYLNRHLFLYTVRARHLALPEPTPAEVLNPLVSRLASAVETAQQAGRVVLDATAAAAWAQLYVHLDPDEDDLLAALQVRAAPYLLRLALCYALLDESREIGLPHLRAAVAVWDYHVASLHWVFGRRTGDALADRIGRELQARGEMTRTEINDLFNGRRSAAELNEALGALHRAGLAEVETRETRGRPVEVWRRCGKRGERGKSPGSGSLLPLLPPYSPSSAVRTRARSGEPCPGRVAGASARATPDPVPGWNGASDVSAETLPASLLPFLPGLTVRLRGNGRVGTVTAAPADGRVSLEVEGLPCSVLVADVEPVGAAPF